MALDAKQNMAKAAVATTNAPNSSSGSSILQACPAEKKKAKYIIKFLVHCRGLADINNPSTFTLIFDNSNLMKSPYFGTAPSVDNIHVH